MKIEETEAPLHQSSIRKFFLRRKRESKNNADNLNTITIKRRKILKTRFSNAHYTRNLN